MTRLMAGSLSTLLAGALCMACSGGGSSGGGGAAPTSSPTTAPSPPAVVCTPPVQPAPVTNPTTTVGNGTAASVTQVALQTALDAGGTVVFDTGGQALTLTLTAALTVTVNTVLDGGGLVILSGGDSTRIIDKTPGTTLTLQNIDLNNGRTADRGAAVLAMNGGTLTLINCNFSNNLCTSTGPDIGGAAVYSTQHTSLIASGCTFTGNRASNGGAVGTIGSSMEFHNCTFTSNTAAGGGSAQGGIGGAIYIDGVHQNGTNARFELCGCTFTGNTANDHGGAIFTFFYPSTGSTSTINSCSFVTNTVTAGNGQGGAVYHQNGALSLTNTTYATNTSTRQGGGLWLLATSTPSVITNCTFSGNRVTTPGSALGGGFTINAGTVTLTNLTVANNHAELFAGGLFASSSASVTARNCLFANNTGVEPFNGLNVNRELTDGGGNMQWPQNRPNGTTDTLVAAGSVVADPQLSALAANGGPTQTHALPAGSPALDAGTSTGAPSLDQRGTARNDGQVDIGAFEG